MPTCNPHRPLRLAAVLALFCASCGGPRFEGSGFLRDDSLLSRNPETGAWVYVRGRSELAGYERVLLEPIEVLVHPDVREAQVSPEELDALAARFLDELVRALEDRYPIVPEAGPGVLRLRVALTDVIPVQYVLEDPMEEAALLAEERLGTASIEAEGLDSVSGELLFAFADTRSSTGYTGLTPGVLSRFVKALGAFRGWAEGLRAALDREGGEE